MNSIPYSVHWITSHQVVTVYICLIPVYQICQVGSYFISLVSYTINSLHILDNLPMSGENRTFFSWYRRLLCVDCAGRSIVFTSSGIDILVMFYLNLFGVTSAWQTLVLRHLHHSPQSLPLPFSASVLPSPTSPASPLILSPCLFF